MSGRSLASQSMSCPCRARMPLTFHVATFMRGDHSAGGLSGQVPITRTPALLHRAVSREAALTSAGQCTMTVEACGAAVAVGRFRRKRPPSGEAS